MRRLLCSALLLFTRQLCSCTAIARQGSGGFLGLPPSSKAASAPENATVGSIDGSNVNLTSCEPPANVSEHAKARGLSLISKAGSFAVYAAEDGSEQELMVFDCLRFKKLVFLHIPKNAGTTIEHLGIKGGIVWGKFQTTGRVKMPDGNFCSRWHVPPSMLSEPNPYNDPSAEVFCVSRDPLDRMVSEYVYLLSVYHKWPMPHVLDGPKCSKPGFNAFVQNSIASMESGRRFISDCHMVPQWDFVEDKWGHKWCDHVLDIKELTPQFNALMSNHGLAMRMQPHNKANSAASFCPLIKNMALKDVYTPYTLQAMRRMYAEDFRHLGDSLR